MCRNVENIMGLFSEELRILDRNTVRYIIDEMQTTIDNQQTTIAQQAELIKQLQKHIAEFESK